MGLAEGLLGPAAVVDGVLGVVGFLSEVLGVVEGVGRLVTAAAETPAVVFVGRVLAAVPGLVTPAAGCKARPTPGG